MAPKNQARRIVEGGVYDILPAGACNNLGIETDITKRAHGHKVLVLGRKPGYRDCWRVMTITTKHGDLYNPGDEYDNFIPFAPVRNFKKRFPMQLQLIQEAPGVFLYFPSKSYLRTAQEYYIHADGLKEIVSGSGVHWRLPKKGSGSIAQLRHCLEERERKRKMIETDETTPMIEDLSV